MRRAEPTLLRRRKNKAAIVRYRTDAIDLWREIGSGHIASE